MYTPGTRSLRRARRLLLSRALWRRQLVFWLGAILVGVVAAGFAMVADRAQTAFAWLVAHGAAWPVLLSPLVFAVTAWSAARWFPSTPGSGIPQAIAARHVHDPAARQWLLGPRVIAGKMALTTLALLGGASVGREGPTVQVGAAIFVLCASFSGLKERRGVILAGAAAGVAAAFNTPLAGIVFAIEELARGFHHRNSALVLTAIVLSGAASMTILGNYNYFGIADAHFSFSRIWFPIGAIGVAGGLAGSLFARLVIGGSKYLRGLHGQKGLRHPALFAALCGLVIAVTGMLTHGATYGTGYGIANDLLHEKTTVSWGFTAAKFVATLVSNICGIPGGIFSPSLSVGAAMGSAMAAWFPYAPVQGIILLAMVAYFAGVTQAPITAFVIVLEITGKGVVPAPLIATAVIATATARILCPDSLYHVLSKGFEAQAEAAVRSNAASATVETAAPLPD
jgi:H+/Cl- antiporter ClcA